MGLVGGSGMPGFRGSGGVSVRGPYPRPMAEILHDDPLDAGRDHADRTAPGRDRWLAFGVIGCALAAMGVSLVLASAGGGGGVAPGCGPDSGCAEVLNSRWSGVLGLSTAMLAFFTYALLVGATWPVSGLAGWQLKTRPLVRQALAAAVLGAAGWFVYLQVAEIGAFCRWCMTAHTLGVAAAIGTFARDGRLGVLTLPAPVIGLAGAVTLAAVQVMNPPAATIVQGTPQAPAPAEAATPEAPRAAEADSPNATLSLLGGLVEVDPATTPAVGPADASERVVAMVDYACPHCRAAHGLLLDRNVRLLVLPVPLNAGCNPAFNPGQTSPRFADSCTLAELGVAVFLAGGDAAYASYDAAMFAGEEAPDAAEAEAAALEAAPGLTPGHREEARAVVAGNVAAWVRLGEAGIAERIPVMIDPATGNTAVGRLYGPEDLDALLAAAPADADTP